MIYSLCTLCFYTMLSPVMAAPDVHTALFKAEKLVTDLNCRSSLHLDLSSPTNRLIYDIPAQSKNAVLSRVQEIVQALTQ